MLASEGSRARPYDRISLSFSVILIFSFHPLLRRLFVPLSRVAAIVSFHSDLYKDYYPPPFIIPSPFLLASGFKLLIPKTEVTDAIVVDDAEAVFPLDFHVVTEAIERQVFFFLFYACLTRDEKSRSTLITNIFKSLIHSFYDTKGNI